MAATFQSTSAPTAAVQFDRSGRHLTAYISGELDAASAPDVEAALRRSIQDDDERVWLDMSAVSFCDSSGVKMLFCLHREVDEAGGWLVVYSPTPIVRRILEMVDPSHLLAVRT